MPRNTRPKHKDDYLDIEKLVEDYTPLMKSIYKKFCRYNNLFYSHSDYEDLESQIKFEFVKLCYEYNPARGVDFPGFIKFHLQQRVYHYITKLQKTKQKEFVVYTRSYDGEQDDSIDFMNTENLIDETSDDEFEKVEALASLDWRAVSGKRHKWFIESVLFEGKTVEEIAAEEDVAVKVIRLRLYSACNFLIEYAKKKEMESLERISQLKQDTTERLLIDDKVTFNYVERKPIISRKPIITKHGGI